MSTTLACLRAEELQSESESFSAYRLSALVEKITKKSIEPHVKVLSLIVSAEDADGEEIEVGLLCDNTLACADTFTLPV